MTTTLDLQGSHACFGGELRFYRHDAATIGLPMKFSVFLPPQASQGPVPAMLYLAGLTCTEETFTVKAGAQGVAAELGLALPETAAAALPAYDPPVPLLRGGFAGTAPWGLLVVLFLGVAVAFRNIFRIANIRPTKPD